jgi:hypothetical protein
MFDLPTLDQFLQMIADYNNAFWPLQFATYALGIVALLFAIWKSKYSSKVVTGILAFFWLWVGIIFNWLYFSKLFPLAISFAVLFAIQGILLVAVGIFREDLSFRVKPDLYGIIGGILILYGMVGYPLIEYLLGRGYPSLLSFGMVPCPTTVFTLGLLLWTDKKPPKYILIIPFLYTLSGPLPVYLGIVEDVGMIVLGIAATILLLYRDRSKKIV